ncbi:hypothetical protein PR202_gb22418 [Eleusine coracana subsp. coracana]|uniref:Fucosyltransferase n=1 Tax=Eleusine coracana subsp. coracana TaxID=191504 RepID=A0AAV5FDJ6_ELECO|nr:hypothetical protein PR202_gb22418 [Eleusine coracana subsp. coracana]
MFLQSYCDAQVVSGWSAAVYVSHGLAGVRPWMLLPPRNGSRPASGRRPRSHASTRRPATSAGPRRAAVTWVPSSGMSGAARM